MACDFLLMVTALLVEPKPSPVRHQHQHQHSSSNGHLRRAAHDGRHLPGLSQNKSDEEGPRSRKSSSGYSGIHEPK
jgi:hypothetical protein